MSRRSPFESSQFGKSLSKQAAQEQIPVTSQAEGAFSGDTHLQGIPTTDKKARDRDWEKGQKASGYWGVPVSLRDTVSAAATQEGIKVDDLARAFFEYGLEELGAGRLALQPVTNPHGRGKMTLYPPTSGWGKKTGWRRETYDPKSKTISQKSGSKAKKKNTSSVEDEKTCIFVVRNLPENLHQALLSVAEHMAVPIGQVATAFLKAGLDAYLSGELRLEPVAVATRKTLYP